MGRFHSEGDLPRGARRAVRNNVDQSKSTDDMRFDRSFDSRKSTGYLSKYLSNDLSKTGLSTEVSTGRFSTVEIDCRIRRYTCRNRQSISTVGFDRYSCRFRLSKSTVGFDCRFRQVFLSISTVDFRLSKIDSRNRQSISTEIPVEIDPSERRPVSNTKERDPPPPPPRLCYTFHPPSV